MQMRKNLLLLCAFMMANVALIAQTSLKGTVKDAETGEALLFANIELYRNDVFISGTQTDFEGNYSFSSIEPGTYDVQSSYVGYQTIREVNVVVKAGQTNPLNIQLSEGVMIEEVTIKAYKAPLIELDNTTSGTTVTAEKIKSLPAKSIAGIAATSAGLSTDESGSISMRGSRPDATNYFIDGVRVIGLIPQTEVEQLQVINGGIEAKYGDVTGGIISLTSKGPSQSYTGALEIETSEKLDAAGYNLLTGSLSGPILKNKAGQSVLGFRVSGQFRDIADNSPSAVGVYRASEELIRQLEANPTTNLRGTALPTAEFITSDDIPSTLSTRPNDGLTDLNLTAKVDARLAKNLDLSVSGSYLDSKNQFSPTTEWTLLNWTNNPYDYNSGYRINAVLKHKIGTQGVQSSEGDDATSRGSSFRNAYYSLQGSYEVDRNRREDARHQDNLFRYGYFGGIDRAWTPQADVLTDPDNWNGSGKQEIPGVGIFLDHQGYAENVGEFTPNADINPVLASYNDLNGFLDPNLSSAWGLYSNVGQVYNRYSQFEETRVTANITAGFDYLPGGSENGKHSIQLGFVYEQRNSSNYVVAPNRLWEIARLQANNHIIGVDTSAVPLGTFEQTIFGQNFTFPQYQTLLDPNNIGQFAEEVRMLTGQSINEYVNTDGLNPDDLSLSLFSAAELNDQGIISYRGYDYLGNKQTGNVAFNDFFTKKDDKGRRTFDVGAFTPIYGAAYIQDKFQYKDIIFRLGVRLDYYDANTKVLKDNYALYEIENAADFYARVGGTQPDAVNDDYAVYVGGEESEEIVGFRSGDQWYLPNGTAVSNGNVLFNGGIVYPAYVGRDGSRELNIQSDNFDPDTSFDDYTPQINVMPRLAFSFPISEDANFFAHYDILVQRPPSGGIATALDYYYFNDPSRTPLNNPNLRPEKTIDYELGFQQKLTQNSAFKVSAYYKELRDMIQRRFYSYVASPVNQYESTGNLDFGTVKGFSFTYDRRRVGNLEFTANYTLSFANGTGSDVNSSRGINARGVIRNLIPFSYDERHRFTTTMDFRYADGKRYNGPRIGGVDIFANAGVNFIMTAVSGRPYTRLSTPADVTAGGTGYLGSLNGARLPWQFDVDMRLDKNFSFKFSEESKRSLNCNVYLRVENLLDIRNVIGVYAVTGDADNDGYLVSSFGQDRVEQIEQIGQSVESFLSSYQWRVLSPGNYTLPRRIYLGAIFQF